MSSLVTQGKGVCGGNKGWELGAWCTAEAQETWDQGHSSLSPSDGPQDNLYPSHPRQMHQRILDAQSGMELWPPPLSGPSEKPYAFVSTYPVPPHRPAPSSSEEAATCPPLSGPCGPQDPRFLRKTVEVPDPIGKLPPKRRRERFEQGNPSKSERRIFSEKTCTLGGQQVSHWVTRLSRGGCLEPTVEDSGSLS